MSVSVPQRPLANTAEKIPTCYWVAGLTLLAVITRIIHLDTGLWLDEYYSIVEQFRSPAWKVFTTYIGDNQHPLYAVLTSLSFSVFGEHIWTARLPAALFGIASIPALYLLGKQVNNHKEALLAAALLALSYHHVWFSQNARGYTAIALATILGSFYIIRLLDSATKRDALLYGIIVALGSYAHLTMVFVVVGHFLVYLLVQLSALLKVKHCDNWKIPLSAFFIAGAMTLLLYAPILTQVIDFFANKPSLGSLSSPAWALQEAIRSLSIGFGATVVVLAGVFTMLVGIASYWRSKPVALGVFLMPMLVTLAIATLVRGTMYPRFFFALVGPMVLIGVRGVMVTTRAVIKFIYRGEKSSLWAERFATLAMVLVILVSAASLLRNYQYPKMDFEGARAWLESQVAENDVIVTSGSAAWPYREYYLLPWPEMITAEQLMEQDKLALAKGGNMWVVYAFARYMEVSAPEVLQSIRTRCMNKKRFKGTLGGGDIIVCRLKQDK